MDKIKNKLSGMMHNFVDPKFKSGDVVEHKKGGRYCIENVPYPTMVLEYNEETFYLYRCMKTNMHYIRCRSEMEDGRFEKIHS